MYNLEVVSYEDQLRVRFYDDIKTHDAPKRPHDVEVPFTDGDAFNPKSCKGHELNFSSIEEYAQEKLRISCARSKSQLRHICMSFKPKWFLTFTFDPQKVNSFDYDECVAAISVIFHKWMKLYPGLQYVIVAEQHKSGAWHFHGLFNDKIPLVYAGKYRIHKGSNQLDDVYHVKDFPWGFTSATRVKNSVACAFYLAKYLTKNFCKMTKGRRRYWYSTSTIKVAEKYKFLISKSDYKDLKDILSLCLSYISSKGGFSRVDYAFVHFEECWVCKEFFGDIVDFCTHYDDGKSTFCLCI